MSGVEQVLRERNEALKAQVKQLKRELAKAQGWETKPLGPTRDWCCGAPLTGPHVPGCDFEPREDNQIDYGGPVVVEDWSTQPRPEPKCPNQGQMCNCTGECLPRGRSEAGWLGNLTGGPW